MAWTSRARRRLREGPLGRHAGGSMLALALLACAVGLPATSTLAAFSGGRAAPISSASQANYACGVDYPALIQSTPGLTNYWRLGETSGTTVIDSVPSGGTNGTYVGSPTLGGGAAKPSAMGADGSLSLNTVAGQQVELGTINNFAGKATFSVEAWVKRSTPSQAFGVVNRATFGTPRDGWSLYLNGLGSGSVPTFVRYNGVGGSQGASGSERLVTNRWYHLIGTYDGTTSRLYQDGLLVNQVTSNINVASSSTQTTIGGGLSPFGGSIDEVAIYNRALTPAEVQSHTANCSYASVISRTAGLQSYWRLDENSGTNAIDSGPGAVTGTYVNGPSLGQPGALPSGTRTSPRFNVSTIQHLNLGANYAFPGTAPFTIEAWVKPSSVSNYRSVAGSCRFGPTTHEGWQLVLGPVTGQAFLQRWSNDVSKVVNGSAVALNTWTYLVGTYDGSTLRIYQDGALIASTTDTGSVGPVTEPAQIGSACNGAYKFDGSIDEVAIYNRALSSAEVANHFTAR